MVVAKTVDKGPPGPEGTSDGVFVGMEVRSYKAISCLNDKLNKTNEYIFN